MGHKRRSIKRTPRRNRGIAARGDVQLRRQLIALLTSRDAHVNFDDAIKGISSAQRGVRPPGAAHSAWQLLEHLRLCQWDILEFSRNPKYKPVEFLEDYWPASVAPPSDAAWRESIAAFRADLRAMQRSVADRKRDLLARVSHPEAEAKHTLFREALLLADHNAYHVGQLVLLKRLLGAL